MDKGPLSEDKCWASSLCIVAGVPQDLCPAARCSTAGQTLDGQVCWDQPPSLHQGPAPVRVTLGPAQDTTDRYLSHPLASELAQTGTCLGRGCDHLQHSGGPQKSGKVGQHQVGGRWVQKGEMAWGYNCPGQVPPHVPSEQGVFHPLCWGRRLCARKSRSHSRLVSSLFWQKHSQITSGTGRGILA